MNLRISIASWAIVVSVICLCTPLHGMVPEGMGSDGKAPLGTAQESKAPNGNVPNGNVPHAMVSLYPTGGSYESDSPDHLELKSKKAARIYSVVFTAAPLALSRVASHGWKLSDQSITSMFLISAGTTFGPAAGSIYAEDWSIIRNGIISRTASLGLMVGGSYLREQYEDDKHRNSIGSVMLITGLVIFTGSAVYDIFRVSAHSVDYYNARVRLRTGVSQISGLQEEVLVYPDIGIKVIL